MALDERVQYQGMCSITPFSRVTGLPYTQFDILTSVDLGLTANIIQNEGGCNPFAWSSTVTSIASEGTITFKQFNEPLYEFCMGANVTENAAESSGSVTTLTNVKGTSLQDATTGVASVGLKSGSSADLKHDTYVVVAVSATTVDVYGYSNIDYRRGTDKEFVDGTLKITSSPLTITASTAVEIPDFGVELTGGSGTIGMTEGDTATFSVRPPNTKSYTVKVGQTPVQIPEVGIEIRPKVLNETDWKKLTVYKARMGGLPLNFSRDDYSESGVTFIASYDSKKDALFEMERVVQTS